MILKIKEINLKNDAVIIADVHYKKGDEEFLKLLNKWLISPPPQIFLLGDIFHLLLPFQYLIQYNQEAIELIESLALKTEVYYTPGNHDFNLKKIFKNVTIADAFVDKKKSVFLTHGDLTCNDNIYLIYARIVRNPFFQKLANILSLNFINNSLFKAILKKRVVCETMDNKKFKNIVKEKLKSIDYGIIIEGHYHQNKKFNENNTLYINIPAYVCTKSYILIQLDNNQLIKEIGNDGR